jgi:site-specific DNA recombinase
MRVATYSRYSSDQQRESSIEDQQRNCSRRAAAEGWKIVCEFADSAMSGADSARPEYQRMLKAAARGDFDILLIDDLSRLTRDSLEAEKTIRKLEFSGIRIVATSDGYDSQSKARKVHRGFKNLMNEAFLDDLRERVHRGQTGQALKGFWIGGRPYGYRLKPVLHATEWDQYGQPAKIGTKLEIDPKQAAIVKEIFSRYVAGWSHRAIAADLNERNIPSAGATWKRTRHRSSGWMGSAVRVITMNPLYGGLVRWNVCAFVRDPSTERMVRRRRPKAEWVTHQDESLRIVGDEVFEKAQKRARVRSNSSERLKAGGKSKFLLSGLLRCSVCGRHYIIADARSYSCSSHLNGGACTNRIRVRRDTLELKILEPVREQLLAPDRVQRMIAHMQRQFAQFSREAAQRRVDVPAEVRELDARLERLRERLRKGDPDLTDDELQMAIDRVESKRQELALAQSADESSKVLAMLPRAAELYRRQIDAGLQKDPEAAQKARLVLRELLGTIQLRPEPDGSLWADYILQPAALVKMAAGTDGRGEGI